MLDCFSLCLFVSISILSIPAVFDLVCCTLFHCCNISTHACYSGMGLQSCHHWCHPFSRSPDYMTVPVMEIQSDLSHAYACMHSSVPGFAHYYSTMLTYLFHAISYSVLPVLHCFHQQLGLILLIVIVAFS